MEYNCGFMRNKKTIANKKLAKKFDQNLVSSKYLKYRKVAFSMNFNFIPFSPQFWKSDNLSLVKLNDTAGLCVCKPCL